MAGLALLAGALLGVLAPAGVRDEFGDRIAPIASLTLGVAALVVFGVNYGLLGGSAPERFAMAAAATFGLRATFQGVRELSGRSRMDAVGEADGRPG